jgi:transcriptional regulator with XRE-family HTH domain
MNKEAKKTNNRVAESLVKNIRAIRLMRRYTQEYMAEEMEISQSEYSKIESRSIDLSADRLFIIAEILSVSVGIITEFNTFKVLPPPEKYKYLITRMLQAIVLVPAL